MLKKQITNSKSQTNQKKKEAEQTQLVGPNEKTIFKISWDKIQPHYYKHLSQEAKKLKLSGFRQGKVPVEIAKKHLALDHIKEDTLRHEVAHLFEAYVKENDINFLHYPEINPIKTEDNSDWEVEVHYAVAPEIKLKNYQKVVCEVNRYFVNSKQNEKSQSKDKAKNTSVNQTDTREVQLKAIFQALASEFHPTISELLVRAQTKQEFENIARSLSNMGLTVDEYLKKRKTTLEQLGQELTMSSLGQLQIEFILQAVARDEKIAVSDEDLQKKKDELIKQGLKKEFIEEPTTIHHLTQSLIREKTIEHLLSL